MENSDGESSATIIVPTLDKRSDCQNFRKLNDEPTALRNIQLFLPIMLVVVRHTVEGQLLESPRAIKHCRKDMTMPTLNNLPGIIFTVKILFLQFP